MIVRLEEDINTMSRKFATKITVRGNQTGIVYGRQGSFKELVESKCCVIISKVRDGDPRNTCFTITGNPGACDRAKTMIQNQISAVISRTSDYQSREHRTSHTPVQTKPAPTKMVTKRSWDSKNQFAALIAEDATEDVTARLSILNVSPRKDAKNSMNLVDYLTSRGDGVQHALGHNTDRPRNKTSKRLRQLANRGERFTVNSASRIKTLKFNNWKAHMARLEVAKVSLPVEDGSNKTEASHTPEDIRGSKRSHSEAFNPTDNDGDISDPETIGTRHIAKACARKDTKVETLSWNDMVEDEERAIRDLSPIAKPFNPATC